MNSSTDRIKAKQKLLEMFSPGCDPVATAQSLSDDELEAMFDAVQASIPFRKPAQNQALTLFLFAGACRFDRWFVPTPFVVPSTRAARFAKFVGALRRAEGSDPTNCPVFQMHLIKDGVFRRLDGIAIGKASEDLLNLLREEVGKVHVPAHPVKKAEFEVQRSEVLTILDGIADGSLRTVISFRTPYVLHKQPLDISLVWQCIRMQIRVSPHFRQAESNFVSAGGGAALSVGASRWQAGTSHIEIKMATLLDGSAYTEPLQALRGHDLPFEGWPKSFSWAFSIFHDLAWQLRERHGGHQDWVPAPRDLSDLEYSVETSVRGGLEFVKKGSPAELLMVFEPSADVLRIELGEIDSLPWSTECRARAEMYLELGETNEALFWLNVAVESLVAYRFTEIEQLTGMHGLAHDLGSPREFWAQAEEILSKQYPEMADKVKWPVAAVHASVFGKLKALYRRIPMKTFIDELQRRYRQISGERNDLFHGKRPGRVSVGTVMTAFDALTWINENMWPQTAPPAADA